MPKNQQPRIIDIKRGSGTATGAPLAAGTGSGSGGGVVEANAGAGLYYSAGMLNVGAGNGISVAADSVALAATVAGNGLTHTTGVLAVGAGTLVTVGADSVGITAGATYQYIGTAAGTAAAWQNLSGLAGDGLTHTTGVLDVGVSGLGLSTTASAVVLTSSSSPGAAASILATDASGFVTVVKAVGTTKITTPLIDTSSGDLTLQPADDLIIDPASNLVKMSSSVALQASNYASQVTGWRITYDGQADFRYVYTDELHAKAFIADLEQALAGGQIISKSVAIVAGPNFTAPAAGGYAYLYVYDLPSAPDMAVFQSGDIVRLRKFTRAAGSLTIADCWGVVTGYNDESALYNDKTYQRWTFTRSAAPNAGSMAVGEPVLDGAIALDYGTTGNGFYEVNAIDGAYGVNSPYAQTVTWTTHPHSGQTVRTRMGNLYGITTATEYGLYAGTGTDATTAQYLIISDARVESNNIPIMLRNSGTLTVKLQTDGDCIFGSNIGAVATTSLAILSNAQTYNSESLGAGDIVFGDHGGGHMLWDESAGQLKFRDSTTTQILIDTDGILKATNTKLSALGLSIKPEILTVTSGTPEPSATPDDTPTATNYLYFPDPAASWYYGYLTNDEYKDYAGGDTGRVYGYVEHIVPEQEDIGFWKHKSWLVLAAREPTLPADSGSWSSEVYVDADILRPRGAIRAGGAGGLSITDDGANLGVFIEDGGQVGIGTSSPGYKLHLYGNSSTDGGEYVAAENYGTYAAGLILNQSGTNGHQYTIYSSGSGNSIGAGYLVVRDTTATANRIVLDTVGNVSIAGTAVRGTTVGTNALHIFNGTAPAGTLTNGCSLYCVSGKLYAMDSAGTATQLTP